MNISFKLTDKRTKKSAEAQVEVPAKEIPKNGNPVPMPPVDSHVQS